MAANTPEPSRSDLRELSPSRSLTAAETATPTGDAGIDTRKWNQVLFALTGNAEGLVNARVYRRYPQYKTTAGKGNVWIPGETIDSIGVVGHAATTSRGPAALAIPTLKADRVQLLITSLTTVATVYVKCYGLAGRDEPLWPTADLDEEVFIAPGAEVKITDGTDDLLISGAGAAYVAGDVADDAADIGWPVKIGGKATAAEPTPDEGDRANLSLTLFGRARVDATGDVAHNAADAGNPLKVGAKATAAEATVDEGDRANLSVDLSSRLRAIVQGLAAHDATATGNPVRAGGVYHATAPTLTDGDVADLLLDGGGRQLVVGAGAENAAVVGSPLLSGGRYDVQARTLDDGDGGAVALNASAHVIVDGSVTVDDGSQILQISTEGAAFVVGIGAENAAVSGNPVLNGGRYDTTPRTLDNGDKGAIAVDIAGRTIIAGNVADDAADTGAPAKVGGRATQAQLTPDNNDRADLNMTLGGRARVDAEDHLKPNGVATSINFDGSVQAATQLTVGRLYYFVATEDCHLHCGASVTASVGDFMLLANTYFPFRPESGETVVTAIKRTTAGKLFANRASRE